jgi:F-type H+-transporting ATPase subunit a
VDHGFTWPSAIPILNWLPDHTATALLVVVAMLTWASVAGKQIAAANDAVIPDDRFSLRNLFEIYLEGFQTMLIEPVLGDRGRIYLPFYASLFLFILINNLVGLIPGFSPATSNVNTTLGLGLLSFVMYNYYGFKESGSGYLKHFLGPVIWMAPLMGTLEIIDHLIRPVTLNLRLMMNMFADHLVLDIFTNLTYIIIPVVFLALGTFVSIVQAYVFTLLSLVYVGMATTHHDDHGHGGDEHHH